MHAQHGLASMDGRHGCARCLIWILYLPFYLLRTRGKNGWFWMVGLFTLAFLGTILRLAIYAVS